MAGRPVSSNANDQQPGASPKKAGPELSGLKSGFLLANNKPAKKTARSTSGVAKPRKQDQKPKNSFGFAKGFLNAKTSGKRKIKQKGKQNAKSERSEAARSQALLEIDEAPQGPSHSSLLVAGERDEARNSGQKPLVHFVEEHEVDSLPASDSQRPQKSLIQVVDEEESSLHTGSQTMEENIVADSTHSPEEDTQRDQLSVPNFSNRNHLILPVDNPESHEEELFSEVSTKRRDHDGRAQAASSPTLTLEMNTPPLESVSKNEECAFFQFQQHLESLVWTNKADSRNNDVSKEWTPTMARWAWQWTLSQGRRRKPFIHSLLLHHPAHSVIDLRTETQEDRVGSLQVVRWLLEFLSERPVGELEGTTVEQWGNVILSALVKVAEQPRRTVLAQDAWKASTWIILHVSGKLIDDGFFLETKDAVIWEMSHVLNDLLEIQLSWQRGKKEPMQRHAQVSILEDWRRVNNTCRNQQNVGLWLSQVLGSATVGGLPWGGLQHTLCGGSKPLAADSEAMEQALNTCLQPRASEGKDSQEVEKRLLLRGVLCELQRSFKWLHLSNIQQIAGGVMQILPDCAADETVDVGLAILTSLWSNSHGLPPDIPTKKSNSGTVVKVPESLELLFGVLGVNSEESKSTSERSLNPSSKALCVLAARCILSHPESLKLAKEIASRYGTVDMVLHVFVCMVSLKSSERIDKRLLESPDEVGTQHVALSSFVTKLLIDNITKSGHLRSVLLSSNAAALADSTAPLGVIIPKLVGLLPVRHEGNVKAAKSTEAVLTLALTSIMRRQATVGELQPLIHHLVVALESITARTGNTDDGFISSLCTVFAGKWRRVLLEAKDVGDYAFANVLEQIGKEMLQSPSSLAPLEFLGAVVGEASLGITMASAEFRILLAIERVVDLCAKQLQVVLNPSTNIYARLSPLLILHRIPLTYFKISLRQSVETNRHALRQSGRLLAECLAVVLGIESPADGTVEVSPNERRLAAGIIVRCFCFAQDVLDDPNCDNPESISSFQRICSPAFVELLASLSGSLGEDHGAAVRHAQLGLFIACQHVTLSTGSEACVDDAYRKTAAFAMYCIAVEADTLGPSADEMGQLQTGCIEYFAACVEQRLSDIVRTKQGTGGKTVFETAEDCDEEGKAPQVLSTSGSFATISRAVVRVLQSGLCSDDPWLCTAEEFFLGGKLAPKPKQLSPSSLTCLWNALILVAKRCDDDSGSLKLLSRSTLGWLGKWCVGELPCNLEGHVRDPLCIAAGMQVMVILLTRNRSFEGLGGTSSSERDAARKVHAWALRTLEHVDDPTNATRNYAFQQQRLLSVKLLLTIVTIDRLNSDDNEQPSYLGPGELGMTFTVFHGLANMDVDPDVRELSSQLLSLLHSRE